MLKSYLAITALLVGLSASFAHATTVTVTSPTGLYTNPGTTGTPGPGAGYDTWFANNVRSGGAAGITSAYADNGNGSIQFHGTADSNSKADFEYYFSAGKSFLLSDLTAFSYDEYRASSSTASAKYEPALRLYVSDGTHSGYLVYEGVYNNQPSSIDSFSTVNVFPDYLWGTGNLPGAFAVYNRTIADWVNLLPNLQVYALSVGIGSGWDGTFDGAVDNITYGTKAGGTTTYNFETPAAAQTPEPGSLTLLATGMLSTYGLWKRKRILTN